MHAALTQAPSTQTAPAAHTTPSQRVVTHVPPGTHVWPAKQVTPRQSTNWQVEPTQTCDGAQASLQQSGG